ncbi:MAG: penicillin-binding transpeptidase domain-containing protein [Anaerovoracaceae bacterium]|jgi:penicillin-binding protein 2
MNTKWIKERYNQILLTVIILMLILIVRLFFLTVVQGDEWALAAQSNSMKNIYQPAPRGQIFDRYGRLLAGNKSGFSIQFSDTGAPVEEVNRQALEVVRIIEASGDAVNDNLPLIPDKDGGFQYIYEKNIEEWLANQEMPKTFTAEQAFNELCRRNGIDEMLDRYDAQIQLQTVFNVYPPISVKTMTYTEELAKENFLGQYGLDFKTKKKKISADETFKILREKFKIGDHVSDADARKIMIIRNELWGQGYYGYIPISIAQDVSQQTIVTVEERGTDLYCVDVAAEPIRYYPNGNSASHILGYLGRITEGDKEAYLAKGYSINDMVGRDGLEKAYEDVLKGVDGMKTVEVNAYGERTRNIQDVAAQKGQDIYLTIDLELQKTAEAALKQALQQIRAGGTFQSEYGNYKYSKAYPNANVGAAVAIDVETGDVLAMASAPDFDPNLFVKGISTEDWRSLQPSNPRDQLAPRPLYNVSTLTAVQPGSTFKMVTATAALESGLNPNRKLKDGGAIKLGERTYGCVLWNRSRGTHGYLDLHKALEVSCNYYFYDIATGKDWYTGKSLGYRKPISIGKITDYAEQYGLGKPTGIEIAETVVPVPSESIKLSGTKNQLRNVLIGRGEMYFTDKVVANKELLRNNINTIVGWTEENPTKKEILSRLPSLGVKSDMLETVADLCKYTYFNFAKWTTGDEFNIAIGQGENSYTPLQMANYVATIGNKGVHNKVRLVGAIEKEGRIARGEGKRIELENEDRLKDIIEGMRRVSHGSQGSGKAVFNNFPVQVASKTGTAERAGKVPAEDEIQYLKTYLPKINPQLSWSQVETELSRLMKDYPEIYTSRDSAARQAVINLSRGKVTVAKMDAFKKSYDNFSWFVGMAPADNPKIAVSVLIFQGGSGGYAGPVAKEIIGSYLQLNKVYEDYSIDAIVIQ